MLSLKNQPNQGQQSLQGHFLLHLGYLLFSAKKLLKFWKSRNLQAQGLFIAADMESLNDGRRDAERPVHSQRVEEK